MLGDRVLHQRRAQLQMLLADVGRGARHPERAVLHLLAQVDQEGLVVGELEPPARQLADQRRRLAAVPRNRSTPRRACAARRRRPYSARGDVSTALHVNDAHATISSIMKPTMARPLSGTTQRIRWPGCSRARFQQRVEHDPDRGRADVARVRQGGEPFASGIIAVGVFAGGRRFPGAASAPNSGTAANRPRSGSMRPSSTFSR